MVLSLPSAGSLHCRASRCADPATRPTVPLLLHGCNSATVMKRNLNTFGGGGFANGLATHRLRTAVLNSLTIHSSNRRPHPVPGLCPRQEDTATHRRTQVPLTAFILALNFAEINLSLSLLTPPPEIQTGPLFLDPLQGSTPILAFSMGTSLHTPSELASLSLNCSCFLRPRSIWC